MRTMLSVGGNPYSKTEAPADELIFGSVDGVALLSRSGQEWQVQHRALEGLHVSSLADDARSGITFAGTHNGGLHASRDGGKSWLRRSNGIAEDEVYSLAVAEAGDQVRVYAGTEPAHLYVSTDLGETWTDLPGVTQVGDTDAWTFPAPPHIAHTKFITTDPRNPDTIYACIEQGALVRSTDAGKSFQVMGPPEPRVCH